MKKQLLLAVLIGFAGLSLTAQDTKVSKTIKVLDFLDKAVIDANQAKGGMHTVADAAARKGIKSSRVTVGMLVSQTDNKTLWRLISGNGSSDAHWEQIGTLDGWKASTAYKTGQPVLRDSKLLVWAKADGNSASTFTAANWREVGKAKIETVAKASLRPSSGMLAGDIVYVTDDDGKAINGNQKSVYIYDGTAWLEIYKEAVVPAVKSGTVYAGVVTKTLSNISAADIQGSSSPSIPALANTATGSTISVVPDASIADQTSSSSPVDRYYVMAYPADWTGTPIFKFTFGGATHELADCWNKRTMSLPFGSGANAYNRSYTVYHCDVNFKTIGAGATMSVH